MICESEMKAIEARAEAYSVEICGKFNAVVFSDHKAGAIAQAELDAEAVEVLVDALNWISQSTFTKDQLRDREFLQIFAGVVIDKAKETLAKLRGEK